MNIKPSWDSTADMFEGGISNANPQKQQSPLERVGNDASDSIVEALEEYTVPLFNNNPNRKNSFLVCNCQFYPQMLS